MPNWVDEEGYDWFGKIECGRCLQRFKEEKGEVPLHPCHGGWFTSYHDGTTHNVPKLVRRYAPGEEEKYKAKKAADKIIQEKRERKEYERLKKKFEGKK